MDRDLFVFLVNPNAIALRAARFLVCLRPFLKIDDFLFEDIDFLLKNFNALFYGNFTVFMSFSHIVLLSQTGHGIRQVRIGIVTIGLSGSRIVG